MLLQPLWLVLLTFVFETRQGKAAVMHSHSVNQQKERESDGAYSPRDQSHYSDSGEHHSEFDHEAIIGNYYSSNFVHPTTRLDVGSAKEAEEFDHLSPEESKRRLTILLDKMDLNKDKRIDKKELKAWILRSFR